ncbi:MAG: ribosome maturation factor RimM [Gammaproteobacteria bacterium]|nr:ribosome maturation factor RimM [Gammaproteobacteria bacterium]NNF61761.1 ribosome maturation factor RimM [Gammaproteobacteria bacterium]NNM20426.1 ribosome maturation factor RimM [Gammaproteobacteria bacterium]
MTAREDKVQLGNISGLFGVKGWVKVYSFTDPPRNIFNYTPWQLELDNEQLDVAVVESRQRGAGLVARLEGCDDRDQAARLVGAKVWVPRAQLPPPAQGEFYWTDLVGLEVVTEQGVSLGKVARLIETGANDVMVVHGERERLVPWISEQVVAAVDIGGGRITVRWDPDF